MKYRPDDGELLAAIADLLEAEVLPAVGPHLQHKVRVAANLIRILERQQSLEPAAREQERMALAVLLEPSGGASDGATLDSLRAELDRRIATGDPSLDARQVWEVLVATARADLAVAKPGYDSWTGG